MVKDRIDTRPLAEQVYEYLIELLATGVLREGELLRPSKLCEEHGLTQMPLRQALRDLAAQGILEYQARHGYRVRDVNGKELVALYDVREALEGMAARRLAERATESQLRELTAVASRQEQMPVDSGHRLAADRRFHGLIAEFSGNPFMTKLQVVWQCFACGMVRPLAPLSDLSDRVSHMAVVEAIASGDPDEAEAVMRAHVRWGAKVRLAQLRASTASAQQKR